MSLIARVAVGIGVALFAVLLGLGLSIPLDNALSKGRVEALANERIPARGGTDVAAFVARPEQPGPHPAVIMIHEFWGLNEEIVGKAELLAKEGYVVVAPDVFRGRTTTWLPSAIYRAYTTPQARIDRDLDAVFEWLVEQPDIEAASVAAIGFCFGGRAALHYSLHNPYLAATAVFYGRPITDAERLEQLPGPLLGVFGTRDAQIPVSEVRAFNEALKAAGIRHQVSLYEGQGHAFVKSAEAIAEGGAQARAWNELVGFLGRTIAADSR